MTDEPKAGTKRSWWPTVRRVRWFCLLALPGVPLLAVLVLVPLAYADIKPPYALIAVLVWTWMGSAAAMPLLLLDWYRGYRGTSGWRFLVHRCLRAPAFFFGLFSTTLGIGIIVWIFYNLFVERQREFHWGAPIIPLAMIPLGLYWMRMAFTRRAPGMSFADELKSVIVFNADLDRDDGARRLVDGVLFELLRQPYRDVRGGAVTDDGDEVTPVERVWIGVVQPLDQQRSLHFTAQAQAAGTGTWCITYAQFIGTRQSPDPVRWVRFGEDLVGALQAAFAVRDLRHLTMSEFIASTAIAEDEAQDPKPLHRRAPAEALNGP